MNRTNLLRGALALSIPSLMFACNRTAEERAEEEHERAAEARTEVAEERRENLEERREDREENRADPKIQPNQPEGREPTTNAANAVKGLTAESVQLITQARCMREEKCGNVGKDEDYASVSICQQKIGADWRQELNSYDCPGGVVTKELNECLEEIKNEDCASPFDTLGRVVACRSSDICKAVDER